MEKVKAKAKVLGLRLCNVKYELMSVFELEGSIDN